MRDFSKFALSTFLSDVEIRFSEDSLVSTPAHKVIVSALSSRLEREIITKPHARVILLPRANSGGSISVSAMAATSPNKGRAIKKHIDRQMILKDVISLAYLYAEDPQKAESEVHALDKETRSEYYAIIAALGLSGLTAIFAESVSKISDSLATEQIVGMFDGALRFDDIPMRDALLQIMAMQFNRFQRIPVFIDLLLQLPVLALHEFLKRDDLEAKNESDAFNIVYQYLLKHEAQQFQNEAIAGGTVVAGTPAVIEGEEISATSAGITAQVSQSGEEKAVNSPASSSSSSPLRKEELIDLGIAEVRLQKQRHGLSANDKRMLLTSVRLTQLSHDELLKFSSIEELSEFKGIFLEAISAKLAGYDSTAVQAVVAGGKGNTPLSAGLHLQQSPVSKLNPSFSQKYQQQQQFAAVNSVNSFNSNPRKSQIVEIAQISNLLPQQQQHQQRGNLFSPEAPSSLRGSLPASPATIASTAINPTRQSIQQIPLSSLLHQSQQQLQQHLTQQQQQQGALLSHAQNQPRGTLAYLDNQQFMQQIQQLQETMKSMVIPGSAQLPQSSTQVGGAMHAIQQQQQLQQQAQFQQQNQQQLAAVLQQLQNANSNGIGNQRSHANQNQLLQHFQQQQQPPQSNRASVLSNVQSPVSRTSIAAALPQLNLAPTVAASKILPAGLSAAAGTTLSSSSSQPQLDGYKRASIISSSLHVPQQQLQPQSRKSLLQPPNQHPGLLAAALVASATGGGAAEDFSSQKSIVSSQRGSLLSMVTESPKQQVLSQPRHSQLHVPMTRSINVNSARSIVPNGARPSTASIHSIHKRTSSSANDMDAKEAINMNQNNNNNIKGNSQCNSPNTPVRLIFAQEADEDENGALFYLGTQGLRKNYRNPAELGFVTAFGSPLRIGDYSTFCGREPINLSTNNEKNSYLGIDFGEGRAIAPTSYSLLNRNASKYVTLNWVLEGSADGATFVELDRRIHFDANLSEAQNALTAKQVERLIAKASVTSYQIDENLLKGLPVKAFRYIRIRQILGNSNGSFNLTVSAIEVYGKAVGPNWLQ